MLGGEIQVDSTVGQGSRFTLYLPLIEGVADVPLETRTNGTAGTAGYPGDGAGEIALEDQLADEIDVLEHGDRVVLVIDPNADRARSMVEAVRERGGKAIVARRATAALGLAREHRPSAVLLAVEGPRFESVLGQLKKHPDTRHLPVALVGDGAARVDGLRAGAAAYIDDPVERSGLDSALGRLERLAQGADRRIALIADDEELNEAIAGLLSGDENIASSRSPPPTRWRRSAPGSSTSAWSRWDDRARRRSRWCARSGTDPALRELPLIAYIEGSLSKTDRARLEALAKSAVITIADSAERLVDRAALFLHRRRRRCRPRPASCSGTCGPGTRRCTAARCW